MTIRTKDKKIINSKADSGNLADWARNAQEISKIKRLMPIESMIF